jgi:two-component system sensor histidine kinase MprB
MMRSFSLRRRIAALVAGSVFATVVVVGAVAWVYTRHTLLQQTDHNVLSVAQSVAAAQVIESDGGTGIETAPIHQLSLPFQIIASNGSVTAGNDETTQLPVDATDRAIAKSGHGSHTRTVTYLGIDYRLVTVPIPGQPAALQVGQDISALDESLHKLAVLLAFVSLAGAALAAAAGVVIARAGLRPVRELTAAAERVADTNELGPPIALSGQDSPDDEVARLASSFNDMLAALALSRDRQQALIADAGHELRTPLTSLRTNIELLAREDPERGRVLAPADRQRLLADLTAQTTELASLIGDLTDLAREDATETTPEDLDLANVAQRAVERVRRRATAVSVVTDLHSSPVHGRPRQLERAVTNLLDNAVKWSPPGGEVFVGLHEGELVVADQGPGIEDADLPHIFERFYRATTSREQPGSGLGLAIVAQAAQEHGGEVVASRTPTGGTLMRLTIPLAVLPPDAEPAPQYEPAH